MVAGHAALADAAADRGGLLQGLDVDQQIVGTARLLGGAARAHVQRHGDGYGHAIGAEGFARAVEGSARGRIRMAAGIAGALVLPLQGRRTQTLDVGRLAELHVREHSGRLDALLHAERLVRLHRFAVATDREKLVVQTQFLGGLGLAAAAIGRPRSVLLVERVLADIGCTGGIGTLPAMRTLAVALAGADAAVRVAPRGGVRVRVACVVLERAGRLLLHHGAVAFIVGFARDQRVALVVGSWLACIGQGHVALVLLAQLVIDVFRAQAAVAAIGRGAGAGFGVVAALGAGDVAAEARRDVVNHGIWL